MSMIIHYKNSNDKILQWGAPVNADIDPNNYDEAAVVQYMTDTEDMFEIDCAEIISIEEV